MIKTGGLIVVLLSSLGVTYWFLEKKWGVNSDYWMHDPKKIGKVPIYAPRLKEFI